MDAKKYYFESLSGTTVFDSEKLSKLDVDSMPIKRGDVTYTSSESYEKLVEDNNTEINAKLQIDLIKPGLKKVVSQKKMDLNLSYKGVYSKKTEEETKMHFFRLENFWQSEEVYFSNWRSDPTIFSNALSDNFKNAASVLQNNLDGTEQDEKRIERFINTYGTHVITSSILGSCLNLSYSSIGSKQEIDERNSTDVAAELFVSKSFIEVDIQAGVKIDQNKFASNSNVNVNLNIEFLGGDNQGFFYTESNISNFMEGYSAWAKSTNDQTKNVVIDVEKGSLICVWDLLDDSYSSLKERLNTYVDNHAGQAYIDAYSRISQFFMGNDTIQPVLEDGTEDFPYLISDAKTLVSEIQNHDGADVHFKLIDNIDLSDYNWTPIHEFYGVLDGNDHTIYNLKAPNYNPVNKNYVYIDFIDLNYGTIKNLSFDNADLSGEQRDDSDSKRYLYGGIIGVNKPGATVSNVYCKNSKIKGTMGLKSYETGSGGNLRAYIGMIVGANHGTIEYCVISNCDISAYTDARHNGCDNYTIVGGVVGENNSDGAMSDCVSNNNKIYSSSAGGYPLLLQGDGTLRCWNGYVVGSNSGEMVRCVSGIQQSNSNKSDINSNSDDMYCEKYIGLISGRQDGKYTNVMCVKVDSLITNGNNSENSECLKNSLNDVWSTVKLWQHWRLDNNELYFEF